MSAAGGVDLTGEQKEQLKQFQEVTNMDDNDLAMCTLASVDWNLERAIEAHLTGEAPMPPRRDNNHSFDIDPEMEVVDDDDMDNSVPGLMPLMNQNISGPLRARNIQARVDDDGQDDMREIGMDVVGPSRSTNGRHHHPVRRDTNDDDEEILSDDDEHFGGMGNDGAESDGSNSRDSRVPLVPNDCDDVSEALQNFVTVFEARFSKSAFMPLFYTGSLPDAINEAFDAPRTGSSNGKRPLAIYIHNDKSIAANIFPSSVLCTEAVSLMLRHQFILWPWDITSKENENKLREWLDLVGMTELRQSLDMILRDKERFPILALITKEKASFNLIDVCFGMDSVDQTMGKLLSTVDGFSQIRIAEDKEMHARADRERIRQEQAMEYEMSLAADKARIEQKNKEVVAQREEEAKKAREEEEQLFARKLLESKLPDEPTTDGPGILNIKFRLPEGEQIMRRFRNSEKLCDLFDFLGAKGFGVDNFRMFNADFPKKDVSTFDKTKSFMELKWPAREQIFVEEL